MQPLTRDVIVREIRRATATGEAANSYALHDRLCRTDAVGRISTTDSAYFDAVLDEMVTSGEIRRAGPFVSSSSARG